MSKQKSISIHFFVSLRFVAWDTKWKPDFLFTSLLSFFLSSKQQEQSTSAPHNFPTRENRAPGDKSWQGDYERITKGDEM